MPLDAWCPSSVACSPPHSVGRFGEPSALLFLVLAHSLSTLSRLSISHHGRQGEQPRTPPPSSMATAVLLPSRSLCPNRARHHILQLALHLPRCFPGPNCRRSSSPPWPSAVPSAAHAVRPSRATAEQATTASGCAGTLGCLPATSPTPMCPPPAGTASTDDLQHLLCFDSRPGTLSQNSIKCRGLTAMS
jgi:hypothetical protein